MLYKKTVCDISHSIKILIFPLISARNPRSTTCDSRNTRQWLILLRPYIKLVLDTTIFVAGYFLRGCIVVFHMSEAFSVWKTWSQFPRIDSTIIIVHTLKNIKLIFLAVVCADDKLSKLIVLYSGKCGL